MAKYVLIERPGLGGYHQPIGELKQALDGELDTWTEEHAEDGDSLRLIIVEMSEEEYEALPEFEGW